MEFTRFISSALFMLLLELQQLKASDYCGKYGDKDYYCEKGYCCGEQNCCANYHYYEMWWFWLLWAFVAALVCCCIYHRHQLQRGSANHQYFARFFQPSFSANTESKYMYRLPSYTEVLEMPKLDPPLVTSDAPPPYFDNSRQCCEDPGTSSEMDHNGVSYAVGSSPSVDTFRLTLLNEDYTQNQKMKSN